MNGELPETVLQFGAGNFLRAFADLFIHQANMLGQAVGRIVVVQSTGGQRAQWLNDGAGRYQVVIRGIENGQQIDRVEVAASISRALLADNQWTDIVKFARTPELRWIISNTTEAGYRLEATDAIDASPPRSFPVKLLAVLRERWLAGLSNEPLTVIPCELIEKQAD